MVSESSQIGCFETCTQLLVSLILFNQVTCLKVKCGCIMCLYVSGVNIKERSYNLCKSHSAVEIRAVTAKSHTASQVDLRGTHDTLVKAKRESLILRHSSRC